MFVFSDSASEEEKKLLKGELEHMLTVGAHPNIISVYGSATFDGECSFTFRVF